MAHVSKVVEEDFKARLSRVLALVQESGIDYEEVGIFGSYARDDYKATSDIDFCIITNKEPDRYRKGELRCDADELGADVVFVTPTSFRESDTLFMRNLRRDYRRLL